MNKYTHKIVVGLLSLMKAFDIVNVNSFGAKKSYFDSSQLLMILQRFPSEYKINVKFVLKGFISALIRFCSLPSE